MTARRTLWSAFVIALLGGSALTFLVKGGIIDVMRSANDKADMIEHRPLTLTMLADASAFSIPRRRLTVNCLPRRSKSVWKTSK